MPPSLARRFKSQAPALRTCLLVVCVSALVASVFTSDVSSDQLPCPGKLFAPSSLLYFGGVAVLVRDVDQDGTLDFVVARPSRYHAEPAVVIGLNRQTIPLPSDPADLAFADIDQDGVGDLLVAGSNDAVYLLRGELSGQGGVHFTLADSFSVPAPHHIAIVDLNLDGAPDVAVAGDQGTYILASGGSGQQRHRLLTPQGPFTVGPDWAVAAGDFDADGLPDLAVSSMSRPEFSFLLGRSQAHWKVHTTRAIDISLPAPATAIAVTDFDHDGSSDIAVVASDSLIAFFGAPDLRRGGELRRVGLAAVEHQYGLIAADLDRDNIIDLATTDRDGSRVLLFRGLATGTFSPHEEYPVSRGAVALGTGDLNGDGRLDLVVVGSVLDVCLGQCNTAVPCFQLAAVISHETEDPFTLGLVAADFDGNGTLDLAASSDYSQRGIHIFLNDGSGQLRDHGPIQLPGFPLELASADFNGDGLPDLAATSYSDLFVLLGSGGGAFSAPTPIGLDLPPFGVTAADLNDDGFLDIAVTHYAYGSVSVLLGQGDGTFAPPARYSVGEVP